MALTIYKKKRNFNKTLEPKGIEKSSKSKLSFVVQRHKASRLHYDFRLELDGTLKSWAVPKGPSLNPEDKRLAMMVEDHPYDYKNFEGIIPEGNYGAGIVEIWDEGTYSDIENSPKAIAVAKLRAGLKAGNLKFTLHGKKLKGDFVLVKLKGGKAENAWLLIKHKDKYALPEYNSENHTAKSSSINKWLKKNKPEKLLHKNKPSEKVKQVIPGETTKLSTFIKPMFAKETDKSFDDKDWIFEIKWDGYRAITEIENGRVKLYSRNGNMFNKAYPLIVEQLQKIKTNAVLDGEIVVTDKEGKPNFQLLQDYSNSQQAIQYYVFDILSLDGKNTCALPLIDRKELLKKLIKKNEILKYADHILEKGKKFFEETAKQGFEGIMAKKATSEYYPGKRTSDWLKIKHHKTQEAIIAGFTQPTGSRKYFGALVLGLKKGRTLKYIGHTGTGFNDKSLKNIYDILKPLISKESPFDQVVKTNMPVTWVKPVLVCEIKFSETTNDGIMRHPVFLHLRPDKPTEEVTIENGQTANTKPKKKLKENEKENDNVYTFGKINVKTSNPDKLFWTEENITKGDVINYYISMADYILPYLEGRPQSLKRNPNGISDTGFFHKDVGNEAPAWVKTKKIFSESANKDINYIMCNNKATLVYMANLGCIEINPWHSTIQALDNPDYLVIDIDPSDENTFEEVIETANVIHAICEKAGAINFCKTSGATGMHVYLPTEKKYSYEQVKDFAHIICTLVQEQLPKFTTLERGLQKRGKKIYLDYLQNRRGQTIASVYSLRPFADATVSTPLKWKEVKPGLSSKEFTISTIHTRLKKNGDIFSGILGKGIDLQKCLQNLEK